MYAGPLTYNFHDVNEAYSVLQHQKWAHAQLEQTRNGPALVFPHPVIVANHSPLRRVLFDHKRDANPFFHYMEALWMLVGDNNVKFPATFAANIRNYSDDGSTLHGAYGYRWRYSFEMDQIEAVCYMLKKDPQTRRAVIAMWDPGLDLEREGKDLPCNTHIYFRVVNNALDMTVCNRSNDLVWGMMGANIVHFSVLHEWIAAESDLQLGSMYQFTNNLHVYDGWGGEDKFLLEPSKWYQEHPLIQRWGFNSVNLDLEEGAQFVEELNPGLAWNSRILRDNASPMLDSWLLYKNDDIPQAIHVCDRIKDDDWRHACIAWLVRRVK